nr:F0F1 ATP synthase subunit delta [uncultured Glaciecola sp.]
MPFDWFTIAAQIINFSVLLWLLRYFLYRPILNKLDAREMRLKKTLDEANTKNADAEQRQHICQHKEAELEQQRAAIMEKAETEAKQQRIKLVACAQQDADEILRKRMESTQSVLRNLEHTVLSQNIEEVYATAAKILDDLAGVKLEQAIVDKFLNQLKGLSGKHYERLSEAMQKADQLVVRSAFPLNDEYKTDIERTLTELLSKQNQPCLTLDFVCVPKLMAGLELSVGGWKLAWSIHDHLKKLQDRVNDVIQLPPLKQNTKPESAGDQSKATF